MRRALFRLIVLGAILLGAIAAASQAERWILYPFDPRQVSPDQAGLPSIRESTLTTPDGETLVIWHAPPSAGHPVILYFHGNAGNLAQRAGRFRRFLDRGYGLLAPAYRGSSGSTGTPSEQTLIADAQQVLATLPADTPVIVYGESLGTAVAIALIAALPAAQQPRALILEAPFTSIPDMAQAHYPVLAPHADKLRNQWNSVDRARALHLPLLILHGTQDELIPQSMGRAIQSAAASPRKIFLSVKQGHHTDLWRSDTLPRLWHFIGSTRAAD